MITINNNSCSKEIVTLVAIIKSNISIYSITLYYRSISHKQLDLLKIE